MPGTASVALIYGVPATEAMRIMFTCIMTLRELYATRPLWETPITLDNARLFQFLGQASRTLRSKRR